ncbi:MAG: hypothetical protein HY907_13865 [Deltaproteobacteria bacterium]|nr:hypothetical protein [Deltaproteobacteria bacterium]
MTEGRSRSEERPGPPVRSASRFGFPLPALPALYALCALPLSACGDDSSPADGGGEVDGDGTGDGEGGSTSTFWSCPGDPGCAGAGAAAFEAGVGRRVANPTITETLTVDVDGDGEFDIRDDEFDDVDGDGRFDGVWIAGYGNPRPANDIHDDIETRVLALRSGEKLLAIVSADLIGMFHDDVEQLRSAVADLDIDYLLVACSHNHEGPDTIGLWGLNETSSGVDPAYMNFLLAQMEAAVRDAVADLRPARVKYGRTQPGESAAKGINNVVGDGRDPVILNPWLTVLGFEDAADGSTIATLVNWTAHAEFSDDRINSITADYVHSLRLGIEEGVAEGSVDVPGVGGLAVFTQGALGSQVGPNRVQTTGLDGTEWTGGEEIDWAQEVGRILAVGALRALDEATAPEDTLDLAWVRARVELIVENYGYHAMLLNGIFNRELHGYDPTYPLETGNYPWLWTEVSWLRLGRAQVYTVGGEPCPEQFLGGYDGSYTPDSLSLVDPGSAHPPDLSAAPGPPYLYDRLEGAEYPMTWGLTNDMLGYLIPSYDYFLDEHAPYIDEAFGFYYEETNSIGPEGWPAVERAYLEILERRP